MDSISKLAGSREWLIPLVVLWILTILIGAYLILTTVLIAKDGTVHIEYAKQLQTEPIETLKHHYSQPGYPSLILGTFALLRTIGLPPELQTWIFSAQASALLCRLLTITLLYFMGRQFVGPRCSFWGILVLLLLPDPAKYGSDALSEWPHLLCVTFGLYLLIVHAQTPRIVLIFLVGIAAGLAYLVRPEGAQLLIYGAAWLGLVMIKPLSGQSRKKCVISLGLLVLGFAITVVPYMRLTGYVFPEKRLIPLASVPDRTDNPQTASDTICTASLLPQKAEKATAAIASSVCELLLYYFLPAWLVGCCQGLVTKGKPHLRFLIAFFALLNIAVLLWQFWNYSTISKRYALPLIAVTSLYIPIGIVTISQGFSRFFTKPLLGVDTSVRKWFVLFVVVGAVICTPKLLTPLHAGREPYKQLAGWLRNNTAEEGKLLVPDIRISFYAERAGAFYRGIFVPDYIVRESSDKSPQLSPGYELIHSQLIDEHSALRVYRAIQQISPKQGTTVP